MSFRAAALRAGSLIPVALILTFAAQSDSVRVEPAFGIAGDFGTWTVTYEVGSSGVQRGGSIRVQLPDTWHAARRNSANRLQATDPTDDHYVSARASRSDVRLLTEVEDESPNFLVKTDRRSIDGRQERYVFVVRVTVEDGDLAAGDTIDVVYGDTSGGSRGMRAAIVNTTPEPILVAVDRSGSGDHELLSDRPTIVSRSAVATELLVTGPSTLVVGESALLHLAVVDIYANPVTSFRDDVSLRVVQGNVDLPAAVELDEGRGYGTVAFTPRSAGLIRVEADTRDGLLQARGNPMQVFDSAPADRIFWGDLHSHTRHSWDGVGVGDAAFEYARYVSGLDFYAVTDHTSRRDQDGFTARIWTMGLGRIHRCHRRAQCAWDVRYLARVRSLVWCALRSSQRVLPERRRSTPERTHASGSMGEARSGRGAHDPTPHGQVPLGRHQRRPPPGAPPEL